MSKFTRKQGAFKVITAGQLPELPDTPDLYKQWWEEARLVLNRQRDEQEADRTPTTVEFDSAVEWNHVHALGRLPIVQVVGDDGLVVAPSSGVMSIEHSDINTVKITHASATKGTLILY